MTKKLIQLSDVNEVNWYFNGINLKQSQKYNIIKQKEVVTLLINRFSENDCGLYAIQPVAKTGNFLATLNLESNDQNIS